ncbi:hypothetical protein H072_8913 [Dactylellina haptotyla CBS 200.50]|uniref:Cenp-O kinetochore centromere component n=1 Tax=Dactylellina haptotyla (strain CBS 200.50) TaxID=1284197 RepID=S8BQA9_DACHA|nr:hypothetical protein H072_8913 [Dactylellina haptotyla CBS 200.50]
MSSPPVPASPSDAGSSDGPDVEELQKQIRELTKIRNERQAELLSLRSTHTLKHALDTASSQTIKTSVPNPDGSEDPLQIEDTNLNTILLKQAADLTADKEAWDQEALYRMAGLTSFEVQDPAPNGGKLQGIRIEVMADGKFGTPYYIFLKPYDTTPKPTPSEPFPEKTSSSTHVTIHRHTIPSYFLGSLNSLAEKLLPAPPRLQNLDRLVRDMRRILILHYLRADHLAQVKAKVTENLPQNHPTPSEIPPIYISEFTVDPEARLAEVEWLDSQSFGVKRLGWIALNEEGGAEGIIVKQDGKRVLPMELKIKGNWVRGEADKMSWIDGLFDRLEWAIDT